jgi:hypothetical protein
MNMPEENEKGFTIKDKRTLNETEKAEAADDQQQKKEDGKQRGTQESSQMPLPEINFASLIFSLSSTALLHLGELPDPQTNEKKKDLPLAKHAIDTIAMLKEKTVGNLSTDEEKFIVNVLTDLRLRYVKRKALEADPRQRPHGNRFFQPTSHPFQRFCSRKIEHSLKITGRRPDGYHELVSVMVPVALYDPA